MDFQPKGITMKDALKKWESANGVSVSEAVEVKLIGCYPPIDRLDVSISALTNCEKLSLSTNCIEKITNIQGLTKLKVLSIGRNLIKNLAGIEILSETLEQLWASYNSIEKLRPICALKRLKVLYISNNLIKDINEVRSLVELPFLEELVMTGNPIQSSFGEEYRSKMAEILPAVKKLDGYPMVGNENAEFREKILNEEQTLISLM